MTQFPWGLPPVVLGLVLVCALATVATILAIATGWMDDPRDIIFALILLGLFIAATWFTARDASGTPPTEHPGEVDPPEKTE